MRGVLVAGGTGALGAGVLRALLGAGYPVTTSWLVEKERDRVESEFAGADGLSLVEADLMDPAGAEAAVEATPDLGAVVNLVGGFAAGPLAHETDVEEGGRMVRLATPAADFSKGVPPDEIGRVVRFLVSDESAPTSGAGIPVYGRA